MSQICPHCGQGFKRLASHEWRCKQKGERDSFSSRAPQTFRNAAPISEPRIVIKQTCPDCGGKYINLSDHKKCPKRGSGRYAAAPREVEYHVCPKCHKNFKNLAGHKICHGTERVQEPRRHIQGFAFDTSPPTPPPTPPPVQSQTRYNLLASDTHQVNQLTSSYDRQARAQMQHLRCDSHNLNRRGYLEVEEPRQRTVTNSPNLYRQGNLEVEEPRQRTVINSPNLYRQGYLEVEEPRQRTVTNSPNLYRQGYLEVEEPRQRTVINSPNLDRQGYLEVEEPRQRTVINSPNLYQRGVLEDEENSAPDHPYGSLNQLGSPTTTSLSSSPLPSLNWPSLDELSINGEGDRSYNGLSHQWRLYERDHVGEQQAPQSVSEAIRQIPIPPPSDPLEDHLSRCLDTFGCHSVRINRDSLWTDSLNFFKELTISDTDKKFMVTFVSEDGVDWGGPRREYLRLLCGAIIKDSGMLCGDELDGFLIRPSYDKYRQKQFCVLGVMLASIIAQGGQPPAILAPPVVDAILDRESRDKIPLKYIPDALIRDSLQEVLDADDMDELAEALDNCEWRRHIDGIPTHVTMRNKEEFVTMCSDYFVLVKSRTMLDQMLSGLKHCGILDLIRTHNLRNLLEYDASMNMTSGKVIDLLTSCTATDTEEERQIIDNLKSFLHASEDGTLCSMVTDRRLTRGETSFIESLKPESLLTFITGCSREPAGGFRPPPNIFFVHSATWRLPSVSTCSNQLTLTVHQRSLEASSFYMALVTSMMNSDHFNTP